MGLPTAHPWLCLLMLSPQLDSSQALGRWSLSTWQRWCAGFPRKGNKSHSSWSIPAAHSPGTWFTQGCSPSLPCWHWGRATQWCRATGRGQKQKQGAGKSEAVTKFSEWKAHAFQKWWSTTPCPKERWVASPPPCGSWWWPARLVTTYDGFMPTCHPRVSWMAAPPTPV